MVFVKVMVMLHLRAMVFVNVMVMLHLRAMMKVMLHLDVLMVEDDRLGLVKYNCRVSLVVTLAEKILVPMVHMIQMISSST